MDNIQQGIKIMSLNVNRLGNPVKRAKVMTKIKKEKNHKKHTLHKQNTRSYRSLDLKILIIVHTLIVAKEWWLFSFLILQNLNA